MHIGALKKWALALTFWLALHTSSLRAQIFTNDLPLQAITTGTDPVDFEFRADGTLIAKGNYGVGSLGSGDEGAGTRMLWFPSLGAFRAGVIDSSSSIGTDCWDPSNIGVYSVAFGNDTKASGANSMAFGSNNIASGIYSIAGGSNSTASGYESFAFGGIATASGQGSIAMGNYSVASAEFSVAMGFLNTATAKGSTASGYCNTASGCYSSASGYQTTASAYASFVVGFHNVGGGSSTSWVATDPLFEVGNGTINGYGNLEATGASDALVVYKNGSATFQGPVTVAPGGDIPMYTGE